MSDVTIRDASVDDAAVIAGFNAAMALETEGRALDEATVRRGVRRAFDRPGVRYFVAEVDGGVAGQMMVTYEWTDWRDGVFWWIQSVYVAPEARRRGVFRAIYGHVKRLAESDADCRGLRLYVERDNADAAATYAALGMTRTDYDLFEHDWS